MKQTAVVVNADESSATIRVVRSSACSSCSSSGLCEAFCGKPIDVKVKNSAGALPGDVVEVESRSETVLAYSALTFAAPVAGGLAAYYTAAALGANETVSYISAAAVFTAALLSLFLLVKIRAAKDLEVNIVRIIDGANKERADDGQN